MLTRRKFITLAGAGTAATLIAKNTGDPFSTRLDYPIVISTWDAGIAANRGAWKVLSAGGRANLRYHNGFRRRVRGQRRHRARRV